MHKLRALTNVLSCTHTNIHACTYQHIPTHLLAYLWRWFGILAHNGFHGQSFGRALRNFLQTRWFAVHSKAQRLFDFCLTHHICCHNCVTKFCMHSWNVQKIAISDKCKRLYSAYTDINICAELRLICSAKSLLMIIVTRCKNGRGVTLYYVEY